MLRADSRDPAAWPRLLLTVLAIAVLWPGSRRLSVKVRTVIDFFVECFGEVPYWDRP